MLTSAELSNLSACDAALARGVTAGAVEPSYLDAWRARRDAALTTDDHDLTLALVSEANAVVWRASDVWSNFRLLLADPLGYLKRWLTPGAAPGVNPSGGFTPFAGTPVPAGAVRPPVDPASWWTDVKPYVFVLLVVLVVAVVAYVLSQIARILGAFRPARGAA